MGTRTKASPPPFKLNSSIYRLFQTATEGGQYHGAVNVRADQVVPGEKPPKGGVFDHNNLVINYVIMYT